MKPDYVKIGNRISELRRAQRMTQAELAEECEVEPSYISNIERAVKKPSLSTLVSIANTLGATLDQLVYGNFVISSQVSFGAIEELLSDCTSEQINALAEVIKTTKNILCPKK